MVAALEGKLLELGTHGTESLQSKICINYFKKMNPQKLWNIFHVMDSESYLVLKWQFQEL